MTNSYRPDTGSDRAQTQTQVPAQTDFQSQSQSLVSEPTLFRKDTRTWAKNMPAIRVQGVNRKANMTIWQSFTQSFSNCVMCLKLEMETLLDIAVIVITIYSLTISIHIFRVFWKVTQKYVNMGHSKYGIKLKWACVWVWNEWRYGNQIKNKYIFAQMCKQRWTK